MSFRSDEFLKKQQINNQLNLAVAKAEVEKVRQLISEGADVNSFGEKGIGSVSKRTPLWAAVNHAATEISEEWREFCEALHDVALSLPKRECSDMRRRYLKIIETLLESGADTEIRCFGTVPLGQAVHGCDFEVVVLLLSKGANPNAESFSIFSKLAKRERYKVSPGYYDTVLHQVVETGSLPIVRALLAAGADPKRTNHEGKTALDIVKERGAMELICLLEQASNK